MLVLKDLLYLCFLMGIQIQAGISTEISTGQSVLEKSNCKTDSKQPGNHHKSPNYEICLEPECIHTASSILGYMDQSLEPCDDFYRFACGNFLNSVIIPDKQSKINIHSQLRYKIKHQLRVAIEREPSAHKLRAFELIKTYYRTCMNESLIESQGLEPVREILKGFGGWPVLDGDEWNEDNFDWKDSTYQARRNGYSHNNFLALYVSPDLKNNTKRVIYLDQAWLGLDREYFLRSEDDKIVKAYFNYMVDVAVILGADKERAETELRKSLEFERQLANIALPAERRRNFTELYNPMTVRELSTKYPWMNWTGYINTLLAPNASIAEDETVIVPEPKYISALEELLNSTSKRVQANYAIWRVVKGSMGHLNNDMRERKLKYSTIFAGATEKSPRWEKCIAEVSKYFPVGIGSLYIKEYFKKDAKKHVEEMVSNIRQQFEGILENANWMDNETKIAAQKKARSMKHHIAYPDELLNDEKIEKFYENLYLSPNKSYLRTWLDYEVFGADTAFSELTKSVDKENWTNFAESAVVNAIFDPHFNSIEFPAGILQGMYFNPDRPRYMTYGSLGSTIGHEITHGFDDRGGQFDQDGNLREWQTKATKEEFNRRIQCFIDQADNYNVSGTLLKINGKTTVGENIADNGGMKMAYLAYKDWESRNGVEARLPGLQMYNSQQMFWISTARIECTAYKPQRLDDGITTGVHSPAEFRVNGPMSNLADFAKDFNCPIGSKMHSRINKCTIW